MQTVAESQGWWTPLCRHPAWGWERSWQRPWFAGGLVGLLWTLFLLPIAGEPRGALAMLILYAFFLAYPAGREVTDGTEEWLLALPPSRRSRWVAKVVPTCLWLMLLGGACALAARFQIPSAFWAMFTDGGIYDSQPQCDDRFFPFLVTGPPLVFLAPLAGLLSVGGSRRAIGYLFMGPALVAGAFGGMQAWAIQNGVTLTEVHYLFLNLVLIVLAAGLGFIFYLFKQPSAGARR